MKGCQRRREGGKWCWIFRRENPGFVGVNPWNQNGNIEGYRLQIGFPNLSGSPDHDLKVIDCRTGL